MANTYKDEGRWKDDWYLKLPPHMKCAWDYICETVEGCGQRRVSFFQLSNDIGAPIERSDFDRYFDGRVVWLNEDTVWIPGTLSRIYKTLSPRIKAHVNAARKILRMIDGIELPARGVRARTRFENFLGDLASGPEEHSSVPEDQSVVLENVYIAPEVSVSSAELKDTDTDTNTDKNKKGESEGKTPQNSTANFEARMKFDFNALFDLYPRQQKRSKAVAMMAERIHTPEAYDEWALAIKHYAEYCRLEKSELKFILTFPSFVEEWRDWRDWKPPGKASQAGSKFPEVVRVETEHFFTARARFDSESEALEWLGEWRWRILHTVVPDWASFAKSGDTHRLDLYEAVQKGLSQLQEGA